MLAAAYQDQGTILRQYLIVLAALLISGVTCYLVARSNPLLEASLFAALDLPVVGVPRVSYLGFV